MGTYWTGNLSVVDKTGTLIFKLVVNRWVERRPGLQTGANTLHRLLRKHLPLYRMVNPTERYEGDYIHTLNDLNNGTDIIWVYDPSFAEESTGHSTWFWKVFYDGLHIVDNKIVPNVGNALKELKKELGLTVQEKPNAPVYTIGAKIP